MEFIILRGIDPDTGSIYTRLIEKEEFKEYMKDSTASITHYFPYHYREVEKRGEITVVGQVDELDLYYISD